MRTCEKKPQIMIKKPKKKTTSNSLHIEKKHSKACQNKTHKKTQK